jgi:RecG-like helicase
VSPFQEKQNFTPLEVASRLGILMALMQNTTMIAEQDYEYHMQRVSDRTVELALLAGRAPHEIRQSDYERAKREIAGDTQTRRYVG